MSVNGTRRHNLDQLSPCMASQGKLIKFQMTNQKGTFRTLLKPPSNLQDLQGHLLDCVKLNITGKAIISTCIFAAAFLGQPTKTLTFS